MAHSYTCLKYHIVFCTKYRTPWITPDLESELYPYIATILERKKCQMIAIGGIEDHVHILAGFHPSRSVVGMVGAIKSNSSSFGKKSSVTPDFGWQMDYAAFSVSESQVPRVRRYVQRQKQHHHSMRYEDEIRELCHRHGVKLDEAFLKGEPEPDKRPGSAQRNSVACGVNPGAAGWRSGARRAA